jgi:hypothetical protein
MTPATFSSIYQELIDENPLAVRAVLKILRIDFTTEVPTLAVTCAQRPTLRVNLAFVREHCHTDHEVRAVILHEFLHVLLRHTERFTPVTWSEHLAFDAVINAIIHRTMGAQASAMMSRYYAHVTGPFVLLRPPTTAEEKTPAAAGRHGRSGGGNWPERGSVSTPAISWRTTSATWRKPYSAMRRIRPSGSGIMRRQEGRALAAMRRRTRTPRVNWPRRSTPLSGR